MNKKIIIPYFKTTRIRVTAMVALSKIKKGEHVADLGAGDGRISIAFAKKGAIVTAYEIDEKLAKLAQENIKKENLEHLVGIEQKDFWKEDLGKFDIIAVYPMPDIMEELEEKLLKELKPGARVITNYYEFPNWKVTEKKENVFLYFRS